MIDRNKQNHIRNDRNHKYSIDNLPKDMHSIDTNNTNNGLITKIWGPPGWEFFHSVTFGYPINPTTEQQKDYMDYFTVIGKVFPCKYCRESYQEFIKEGDTILTLDQMRSRETLTKWGYLLHERVNKKLDVTYGMTYDELCGDYESYRAKCVKNEKGCTMPLNMKAQSYKKAENRRAPIINFECARALIPHAKNLGLNEFENYLNLYRKMEKNSSQWIERNKECCRIIKFMRKNGINSLDSNGLPTLHEMLLIGMLSTSLENKKLNDIKSICHVIYN